MDLIFIAMNRSKAFVKQYKYEIIAFFVNVISALFSTLFTPPIISFALTVGVFTLSVFVVIYFKTKDRVFYILPMDKPGSDQDWVGRGKLSFVRTENCYEITDSDVGFIFPKTANWDDYKFECDFKIVKKYFGCIVRATNLSNCVMFQIRQDKKIRVHLRISGTWIVIEERPIDKELKPNEWYRMITICDKRKVRIIIKHQNTELIDNYFIIPDEVEVVRKRIDGEGKEIEERYRQIVDFDFGSMGVRDYPDERAFIKNIYLEKLAS